MLVCCGSLNVRNVWVKQRVRQVSGAADSNYIDLFCNTKVVNNGLRYPGSVLCLDQGLASVNGFTRTFKYIILYNV